MHISWHHEARAELIEAAQFYEERLLGLGSDFLDAVDDAVASVMSDPTRYDAVEDDIRRCPIRRFSHDLYIRATDDEVRVLVVYHYSREPGYWTGRS
jgi:hypothetical protein